MNNWFKRNSVHFIIVAILIVISFAYVFTPIMQGKSLAENDVTRAQATQKNQLTVFPEANIDPITANTVKLETINKIDCGVP